MCTQQWSVSEPGLEPSLLSPGLTLLLLLWVDGQCRNGKTMGVGGSGEGKQGGRLLTVDLQLEGELGFSILMEGPHGVAASFSHLHPHQCQF